MSELDKAKIDFITDPNELRFHAENPIEEDGRIHVTPELLFAVADKIDGLRAELARLKNQVTDYLAVNAELVEKVESRDEKIAELRSDITGYRRTVVSQKKIIARLKEDAERLASTYVVEVFPHEWVCRGGCHHWARFGEQIDHTPDCPITLHRALMKELE